MNIKKKIRKEKQISNIIGLLKLKEKKQ